MEQTTSLVETITKGIQEKKGQRIVVADLSSIEGAICRYFVICQGNSLIDEMNRKVQKLKDEVQLVRDKIKAIDAQNAAK